MCWKRKCLGQQLLLLFYFLDTFTSNRSHTSCAHAPMMILYSGCSPLQRGERDQHGQCGIDPCHEGHPLLQAFRGAATLSVLELHGSCVPRLPHDWAYAGTSPTCPRRPEPWCLTSPSSPLTLSSAGFQHEVQVLCYNAERKAGILGVSSTSHKTA